MVNIVAVHDISAQFTELKAAFELFPKNRDFPPEFILIVQVMLRVGSDLLPFLMNRLLRK